MTLVPILTEQLLLRRLTESDAAGVFAILGHGPTTAGRSWARTTQSSATEWLHRRIADENRCGFSMWGVEEQEEQAEQGAAARLVGLCGFFPTQETSESELGYVIHADHWGRGWATEAAGAAVHAMLGTGRSVIATVRPSNEASARVAAKIGMWPSGEIVDEHGSLDLFRIEALPDERIAAGPAAETVPGEGQV